MSASTEFNVSLTEIEREILVQARRQNETEVKGREFAEKVKDTAVDYSPVDEGRYAGAWHVDPRQRTVNGMPAWRVKNDDPKANMIENGTGQNGPRAQGGSSPEFAVRAKTAAHYGGTEELIEAD
ncbi:hypothetical protein ACORG1_13090 [Mycobacterium sp. TJFP1]